MEPTKEDETLSWRAATVIMGLATLFTVTTRLLGLDPFTDIFDLFIVYIPTAILVGIVIVERIRGSSAPNRYPTTDSSMAENTAI